MEKHRKNGSENGQMMKKIDRKEKKHKKNKRY